MLPPYRGGGIIIIPRTIIIALSSQGNCHSSLGSCDECRAAPSDRRPSDQATGLGLWAHLQAATTADIYYYYSTRKLILIYRPCNLLVFLLLHASMPCMQSTLLLCQFRPSVHWQYCKQKHIVILFDFRVAASFYHIFLFLSWTLNKNNIISINK